MNNDRVEGAMKTTGGKIKEAVGKLVGDTSLETEGKVDQVEGKVQNTIGGIKEKLSDKD
jgi:uncharacterized protein YjbJ (UPF0337 family)